MWLSRPFKCLSFFTLAEKRLLKDFTCCDQESLLSIWIPKHVALETKDNSLGPKQIFCKGPINFDLDNNISSVFAGWIVMKLSLALDLEWKTKQLNVPGNYPWGLFLETLGNL